MNLSDRGGQRRPFILVSALLAGLAACGGNDGRAELLASSQSDAQGGDQHAGAAVLVLPLPGPVLQLQERTTVRVRIKARLQQAAHYAAVATASLTVQRPLYAGGSAVQLTLAAQTTTPADLVFSVELSLPAGQTPLLALLTVRAVDVASGLPTGALARALASAEWEVERS